MAAPDLFSAPRRFDLFTVLVAAAGYAVLFTALRLFNAPPSVLGMIGGLFAVVAIGQALAHGKISPRKASVYAATLYWAVFFGVMIVRDATHGGFAQVPFELVFGLFIVAVYGLISGYLVGVLVGGVFLVSYHLRTAIANRGSSADAEATSQDASPWDEST